MSMTTYYKAIRPDGTDFHSQTVQWAPAKPKARRGRLVKHPTSTELTRGDWSTGLAASTDVTRFPGAADWPIRLLEVEPVGEVHHIEAKAQALAWRVVAELDPSQRFGPQGVHVAALIERAGRLTRDDALSLYAAGYAARDAAGDAAGYAARYAAGYAARYAARYAAGYAAWDAAGDAAWYAAWYAARDAAGDAARYAAGYAAWDAAGDAAWYAAWYAAWDAAGDAAWDAARDAARYAAGDAAWDAARDAARYAARYAARDAAQALVVRDLIGQRGFTQAHYDTLTGPWRNAIGPVHPDDADLRGAS